MTMLILTAISIALLHTVSGPDHYLPFIALSRSRGWSLAKTCWWTTVCGLGHVGSSVVLGLGGAAVGWSFSRISWLESVRGGVAGWAFLAGGLLYGLWGWFKAVRNMPHRHFDWEDGNMYVYEHRHGQAVPPAEKHSVTPWVLFILFVLGPCEPMIPLLYMPAVKNSWEGIVVLILVYTVCTLAAMLAMVVMGFYGFAVFNMGINTRYLHAVSGAAIFLCGAGMLVMGW